MLHTSGALPHAHTENLHCTTYDSNKGVSPAYHLVQLVVPQGVDLGPVPILDVGLVLVTQDNAGSGTTQLCMDEGGGGGGGGGRTSKLT